MELPPHDFPVEGLEAVPTEQQTPAPSPVVPELAPARPGPGLPMALVWIIVFMLGQLILIVILVVVLLVMALVQHGTQGFTGPGAKEKIEDLIKSPEFVSSTILVGTGGNFGLALAISLLALRRRWPRAMAIRRFGLFHGLLTCLLVLPNLLIAVQVYVAVKPHVYNFGMLEGLQEAIAKAPMWVILVGAAVFPGLGEELFCRGFLGRGLVARWGTVMGILLASSLFGLIHIEPAQACYAAVIGIVLHCLYLASKSLWPPIIMHALNNALTPVLSVGTESMQAFGKRLDAFEQAQEFPLPLFLASVFAVLGVLLLLYQTRVRWYLPDGRVWNPGYVTAEMPPARAQAVARSSWPTWWGFLVGLLTYAGFVVVVLEVFGFTDWTQGM